MTEQMRDPIPTDYRGTRFRSKSEAIFACAMDLAGYKEWEYEPKGSVAVDFVVQLPERNMSLAIEYKPSEPTAAYLEGRVKIKHDADAYIVFSGSPYKEEAGYKLSSVHPLCGWGLNWIKDGFAKEVVAKLPEAKDRRWDLLDHEPTISPINGGELTIGEAQLHGAGVSRTALAILTYSRFFVAGGNMKVLVESTISTFLTEKRMAAMEKRLHTIDGVPAGNIEWKIVGEHDAR